MIAIVAATVAVTATHALWRFVQYTPFLLGFGAAILSSRLGGPAAGFLSVGIGALGYAWFPPPLPTDGVARLLLGFVVISGTFSWLVGRRYEIEAKLRSSDARLRHAQELAHVGNWEWDVVKDDLWWSDELYRLFGLDRASFQLTYPTFLQLVHPDDRSAVESAVQQAVRDGTSYNCEHRVVRPDGEVRVVIGFGRALPDVDGRVIRLVGATQDITERKAAEDTVKRSERRLQTIFDAEPACVKIVSADGSLLEMNRAGLEMLGADDVSQLLGRSVLDLVHADDRDAVLEMHRQVCSGARRRAEFRIISLNGQEHWVDAHFVPFERLNESGERQTAVLSVTSDVTDRKRLEEQLRQAQKMEAIGLLAGGIAHDFNNLLTAMGGYAELVLQTLQDDDQRRDDLEEIANAARRAAALTRQLLAVSRRQILEPTVLDVNAMIGDFERLLRRTIPENIDIRLELGGIDPVRADRGQFEQVLLNLAINAADAMPAGGEMRITTAAVDVDGAITRHYPPMPPGRYVRVSVIDTGGGIPPEMQEHIFEPFFTTKKRDEGTGLGLAIVYGIVKQSGGFIWVSSAVGRGTTFEIYLPVVHEPVVSVTTPPELEIIGGSHTILIAEDDDAVRRLTRDVLTEAGYRVLDASDGEQAVQIARHYPGPIHMLIADVVMPGLSGRDLASRLTEEREDVRVLYTSGYTDKVMMRAGFDEGLALLVKPFLPADLLRKVSEVLASTELDRS